MPRNDATKLLTAIAGRKQSRAGHGIALASAYAGSIVECLESPECAARFLDVTGEQWGKALAAAAGTLVYSDSDMEVKEYGSAVQVPSAELPEKTVMAFYHVVTSTKQDSDGDVMESSGAEFGPHTPLLWQHLPVSPIGKYVKTTQQDKRWLKGVSAIADTPLGNDAAVLVEFGALAISHGFIPKKFEPLSKKKVQDLDPDIELGWHVLKFLVREVSTVSIESNQEAAILAFSRKKLGTALCKAWASALWAKEPAKVVSGFKGLSDFWAKGETVTEPPAPRPSITVRGYSATGEEVEATLHLDPTWGKGHKDACQCGGTCTSCKTAASGRSKVAATGDHLGEGDVVVAMCKSPGCKNAAIAGSDFCAAHQPAPPAAYPATATPKAYEVATKRLPPVVVKCMGGGPYVGLPYFAGSFEELSDDLEESIRAYFPLHGVAISPRDDAVVIATMEDEAIVCIRRSRNYDYDGPYHGPITNDFDEDDGYFYYRCTHDDGEWTGEPERVELSATAAPAAKRLMHMATKAGKAVSRKNYALVKEAHGLFGETADHDKTKAAHAEMCKGAMVHCKAVMEAYGGDDDEDEDAPGGGRKKFPTLWQKFNPNHDEAGKFASAEGASNDANAASAVASKSRSKDDHAEAAEAHGTAAEQHEALASYHSKRGNDSQAQAHQDAADYHRDMEAKHEARANKSAGNVRTKDAKVLSATNLAHVKAAHDLADELSDHPDMHRPGKSMMREAKSYLKSVITSANPGVDGNPNPEVTGGANPGVDKDAPALAMKLTGLLLANKDVPAGVLATLHDVIGDKLAAAEEAELLSA